jgi:hypothetical protein
MKYFLNDPSSPPIKAGSLLLIQQHLKEESRRQKKHSKA